MRKIAMLFLFAVSFAASAVDLQSETGQCRFGRERNGTFYNEDLHTENYLNPACWSFGVLDKWKGSRYFGWRAAFLATGQIQARDNLATNDELIGNHAGHTCAPPDEAGCMVRFNGSGSTFGISTSLTAEVKPTTNTGVMVEGGLFFFQHHFKAEARHIDPAWGPGGGRQISYNETSKITDQPSPFVGLTVRYRMLYATVRHYWPAEHRVLSLTDFSMDEYKVGLIVPW